MKKWDYFSKFKNVIDIDIQSLKRAVNRNRKPAVWSSGLPYRHTGRKYMQWLVLFFLLFVTPHQAYCQNSSSENDLTERKKQPRFNIATVGIYSFLNTNLRFETPGGLLGVQINMEDNLGLDQREFMFVGSFMFNIKKRHYLYGLYYNLPRRSEKVLEQDIEFDTLFIPAGTGIKGYFNTAVYSLGYMYQVLKEERSELGFYINFYTLTVASGVKSDLGNLNESFRITAPLPNLGLMFKYQLGKRFSLGGNYGFFFLKIGNYKGSINNLSLNINYRIAKWLNMGVGYYVFNLNIEAREKNFTGIIDYTYQGPFIGTSFQF